MTITCSEDVLLNYAEVKLLIIYGLLTIYKVPEIALITYYEITLRTFDDDPCCCLLVPLRFATLPRLLPFCLNQLTKAWDNLTLAKILLITHIWQNAWGRP